MSACVVLAVLLAVCFFSMASKPFSRLRLEAMRAEVAREMIEKESWIVPCLANRPLHTKPPLFYWTLIGSYKIFGVNEAAARLPVFFASVLKEFGFEVSKFEIDFVSKIICEIWLTLNFRVCEATSIRISFADAPTKLPSIF